MFFRRMWRGGALLAFAGLAAGCSGQEVEYAPYPGVYAEIETDPVASSGDAADDPAIWIDFRNTENSLILGTDKRRGLMVYNLDGRQRQALERGRLNNVDLRQGITLAGTATSLAVATNRSEKTLDIFAISAEGTVEFLLAQPLRLADPYGLCMFRKGAGDSQVFVNSKDGAWEHWQLTSDGVLAPELLGGFAFDTSPEGCVVDDETATLYAGEEEHGIWVMPADFARADEHKLLDTVGERGHLVADVEGMSIFKGAAGEKFLLASSQGDASFAVYDIGTVLASDLSGANYLGSFRVLDAPGKAIDGAEDTDGLDVTPYPLGARFPRGALVVQDGENRHPDENQNFKLIDWRLVEQALEIRQGNSE